MAQKHLHKYRRINIGRKKEYLVMQCVDCSHYTPMSGKTACIMLEGKIARCSRCDEPFQLDRSALTMANPHCSSCTNKKVDLKIEKTEAFFDRLMELAGSVGKNG